jgi:uncharacterized protein YjbI with pentapeptide repeats
MKHKRSNKNLFRMEGLAYLLMISAIICGVVGFLLITFGSENTLTRLVRDFYANVVTDLLSIGFGILVIDKLYQKRNDERERRTLISQMASPFNILAGDAARIIHERGWHTGLDGISLWKANLEEAELYDFDLSNANLTYANLKGANLNQSILDGAVLHGTNLSSAHLNNAKLTNSEFRSQRAGQFLLKHADLIYADLTGATFKGMAYGKYSEDEQHIQLQETKRLQCAIMPNGKKYDGRYSLEGDISIAKARGVDINNKEFMAKFYEVTVEEYKEGQEWYKMHGKSPMDNIAFV